MVADGSGILSEEWLAVVVSVVTPSKVCGGELVGGGINRGAGVLLDFAKAVCLAYVV